MITIATKQNIYTKISTKRYWNENTYFSCLVVGLDPCDVVLGLHWDGNIYGLTKAYEGLVSLLSSLGGICQMDSTGNYEALVFSHDEMFYLGPWTNTPAMASL